MTSKHDTIAADKLTIERLGGAAKVAELLEYDKSSGGVQRVFNWMTRGIPPAVKVEHPNLFLTELTEAVKDS